MRTSRIILSLSLFLILAFIFVGCGSKKVDKPVVSPQATKEGMEVQVPEWFAKLPTDPNYLYAAGTVKSRDMGMAVEQAMEAGRMELGRQVSVKVTSMMKRFQEETGSDEDSEFLSLMTTASKSVSAEVLNGSKCIEKKTYKEGTGFRSYALMELPIGVMNSALLEKIKDNKNMYTRFRASEAFKELEEETAKYEQFKKEQGQGTIPQ
jgi:hypothetical protein